MFKSVIQNECQVLIQNYSASWEKDFESIKLLLLENIQNVSILIEHIGSTAVPKLDAKPIIDIDIVYFNDTDFEIIKSHLEKIGYYHNGNQGIVDRDVFKRSKIDNHPVLDTIFHHLYVCPKYSHELQRHLLFRDYLRKNEWARKKYQNLKYEVAEEVNQDRKKYAQLKEERTKDFINKIIMESL